MNQGQKKKSRKYFLKSSHTRYCCTLSCCRMKLGLITDNVSEYQVNSADNSSLILQKKGLRVLNAGFLLGMEYLGNTLIPLLLQVKRTMAAKQYILCHTNSLLHLPKEELFKILISYSCSQVPHYFTVCKIVWGLVGADRRSHQFCSCFPYWCSTTSCETHAPG